MASRRARVSSRSPFASSQLGEEQGLIPSDLLGQGRDPADPALDVIVDEGDAVVPVDLRNIGLWLKMLFGAPTTTQGQAASTIYTFSAQPATNATITIGGAAWTFKTSGAAGDQSNIGATLFDTLSAAVIGLNATATAALALQSYALNLAGNAIVATYKTIGVGGNSVTTTASTSPASNATPTGATLAGGATTGQYNHVFASGALTLPSTSIEDGMTDVPLFAMNYGTMLDKMAINLQRQGLLNATLSLIAQGESPNTPSSAAGSPTSYALTRFSQFAGSVTRSGVRVGELVSGNFLIDNKFEKAENIRPDGRIDGGDPGEAAYTGQAVLRLKDTVMRDLAAAFTPVDLTYGWTIPNTVYSLNYVFHRVFLPKPKYPKTGPGSIQGTYAWQGAKNTTLGRAATVTLVNDVTGY